MNKNVITFGGKHNDVTRLYNTTFDDIREAKKFIKEANSEYSSEDKYWEISVLADDITELELSRKELESLL